MNLKISQVLITTLCLCALFIAIGSRSGTAARAAAFVCLLAAMVLYYRNIAALSQVSEDNPKVKTLKFASVFTAAYAVMVAAIAIALEKGFFVGITGQLTERQQALCGKFFMALLSAIPMAVLGNLSPKLPFNRYTGLRLPWTLRDEETWVVAHRLVGYLSLPLAILLFAGVPTEMTLDTYMKFWWLGALILWIGIPGILSGLFFYRKYSGKP